MKKNEKKLLRLLVTAVELVNAARRVDELLLAGEERVALRADADLHLRTGGFNVPDFAAGAGHNGVFVLRMNVFFHFFCTTPFYRLYYKKLLFNAHKRQF